MDWGSCYAEAVDEVNAIDRAILGPDAQDIPRRKNPSMSVGDARQGLFPERPPRYFKASRKYLYQDAKPAFDWHPDGRKLTHCVHGRSGDNMVPQFLGEEASSLAVILPQYDYRRIEECPEHRPKIVPQYLYDLYLPDRSGVD